MWPPPKPDVACPKCGHLNSVLLHEFEESAETHFVCVGCKVGVRLVPDPKATEAARNEVSGDKVLMSSDALVRAVKAKIVEILIGY